VVAQEGRPTLARPLRRAGVAHVLLDGPLGHAEVQLQQLAPDSLRTPEPIRGGHRPDQRDRLLRHLRATRPWGGPRLPPPEAAEELAVPAQERLWLHDEDRLPPSPDAARQDHQERPVDGAAAGALDAAAEDEELLAQQRVFGDQLRSTAAQIRQQPGGLGRPGRLRGGQHAAAAS